MKKLFIYSLIFSSLFSCTKDDDQTIEEAIKKLPAATQTGEGIFACLVNGKPFIADNEYFNCFYQYVDGGYYFNISGDDKVDRISTIRLQSGNKQLFADSIYTFERDMIGNVWGEARLEAIDSGSFSKLSTTSENFSGEMKITNFDQENFIVSGTFWMNLEDPFTGDTIKVRNGRFDTLFYP